MNQKDIDEYFSFVEHLSDEDKLLHKNYLRDLQNGKIYGPMTGYASIDEPWLKGLPIDADKDKIVPMTMWQVLKENSKKHLDKKALYYEGTYVTYQELIEECEHFARSFDCLGIKSGDNVMICMANTPEFVYAFYGLIKLGAIPNLIEPRTNAKRILSYIDIANAKYMIMVNKCYENIEKIADDSSLEIIVSTSPSVSLPKGKKILYDLVNKKVRTHGKYLDYKDFYALGNAKRMIPDYRYVKDETAVVVYTSGTSGVPKGVCLRNETYNGQNLQIKYSGFFPQPGEIFLGNVPFFSAYGSSSGMHNALCYGVMIYLIPSPKIEKFAKYIRDSKCTFVMGSPKHFEELDRYLQKHPKERLDYVKCLVSGGDKILEPHEIHMNKTFAERGGPKIKKGLGSTENGGGFTTTSSDLDNKIGSVGIPLAQNLVKIVDPITREELPYGSVGEIEVSSITLANGYLNNPDQTFKAFYIDDNGRRWFRTADMGYIDSDGVVFFASRNSHAIMRPDGHTTPLLPIENAVASSEYVHSCGAIGVKPVLDSAGELPMLFVKLNEDVDYRTALIDIEKLIDENIPPRERPKWIRFIDEIPYTLMEKVDYVKLEKLAEEIGSLDENIIDCRNIDVKVKKLKK